MLNIVIHQGTANPNLSEIPLHTQWDHCDQLTSVGERSEPSYTTVGNVQVSI